MAANDLEACCRQLAGNPGPVVCDDIRPGLRRMEHGRHVVFYGHDSGGERPVAAVLRPEADGGKRYLLCSLCLTEWKFRRMLCPNCGEENHEKLAVYTTTEFPHIRVEACDSCRHYIKAIDLTVDGHAVPEVDELASVALDLWAAENGYTKMAANLFGL